MPLVETNIRLKFGSKSKAPTGEAEVLKIRLIQFDRGNSKGKSCLTFPLGILFFKCFDLINQLRRPIYYFLVLIHRRSIYCRPFAQTLEYCFQVRQL